MLPKQLSVYEPRYAAMVVVRCTLDYVPRTWVKLSFVPRVLRAVVYEPMTSLSRQRAHDATVRCSTWVLMEALRNDFIGVYLMQ